MKCISPHNDVKFNNDSSSSASSNDNKTQNDAAKATAATAALIKNITYFKDYFDNVE
jgi:hypothetical protein